MTVNKVTNLVFCPISISSPLEKLNCCSRKSNLVNPGEETQGTGSFHGSEEPKKAGGPWSDDERGPVARCSA